MSDEIDWDLHDGIKLRQSRSYLPPGICSISRIENGEMKVIYIGRLADALSRPLAGVTVWLCAEDYDRLGRDDERGRR